MAYISFQPSDHFNTVTYTGNGSTQSITGVGFQPDFFWGKARNIAYSHRFIDSTRGTSKLLYSDSTGAEDTASTQVTSFDSDGFSLGSANGLNQDTKTFVAWNWLANGGTTSSNTDGSITSTVQANTTAGFSIVTYTSASGAQTVGHGLGVAPDMYIIKERSSAGDDWFVYHSSLGAGYKLRLSATSASASDTSIWNNTEPTSSVFSLGNDQGGVNQYTSGTQNYVAYCFAEIKGFSKFGKYTGNGSTNGTFVYTGFKPAFVMTKRTNDVGPWNMKDNKRPGYNDTDDSLFADQSVVEDVRSFDILSNGFKLRNSGTEMNGGGSTYIYMAFAEHPLVASTGLPATAR